MRPEARYLVSAAGIPNYGDDYIAATWLAYLAKRYPGEEVWLDALSPGVAAALLSDANPAARFTDSLWELTRLLPEGQSYPQMRARIHEWIHDFGTPRLDTALVQLQSAGSIHLLGGGYLNSMWPRNLGLIAAAAEYSRAFGIPIFATGLGLLPSEHDNEELRGDLMQFNYAESRDQSGAELFGINYGLDDAFLGVADLAPAEDDPDLVVLLQGDIAHEGALDRYEELVHQFVARYGDASGARLVFIENYPPHDAQLWLRMRDRYPACGWVPFADLWRTGLRGRPGQKWLTTRFHAHLLAAVTGASGVAVDVQADYYGVKHASLTEIGTGWTLVSLASDDPLPGVTSSPEFPAHAKELAKRKRELADRLYPHRRLLRTRQLRRCARRISGVVRRRVLRLLGRG